MNFTGGRGCAASFAGGRSFVFGLSFALALPFAFCRSLAFVLLFARASVLGYWGVRAKLSLLYIGTGERAGAAVADPGVAVGAGDARRAVAAGGAGAAAVDCGLLPVLHAVAAGGRLADVARAHAVQVGRTEPLTVCFIPEGLSMGVRPVDEARVVASIRELADIGVEWVSVALPGDTFAAQLAAIGQFGRNVLAEL